MRRAHFEGLILRERRFRLAVWLLLLLLVLWVIPCLGQGGPISADSGRMVVEIVYARSMRPLQYEGREVLRLLGSVRLMHDSAVMTCDSAYVDQRTNTFEAYGGVTIVSGANRITGDTLYYDGDAGSGRMVGRIVRLRDTVQGATLVSDQVLFDTRTQAAHYSTWGVIYMRGSQLRSRHGHYDSEAKIASVAHGVSYFGDTIEAFGDSLQYHQLEERLYFWGPTRLYKDHRMAYGERGWYDERTEELEISLNAYADYGAYHLFADWLHGDDRSRHVRARGRVVGEDSLCRRRLYAPEAYYWHSADSGITHGRSLLFVLDSVAVGESCSSSSSGRLMQEGGAVTADSVGFGSDVVGDTVWRVDTLMVAANGFTAWGDTVPRFDTVGERIGVDTVRTFRAIGRVQIYHPDLQAAADTLFFYQKDSTFHLYRNPFPLIWTNDVQIQAQSITGHLGDGRLDSVEFLDRVMLGNPDADSVHYNQLGGERMVCYFDSAGGTLRTVWVYGETELIYFMRDGAELVGVNRVSSPRVRIDFDGSGLSGATFFEGPSSKILPMVDATREDRWLFGFSWQGDHHPLHWRIVQPGWLTDFDPHALVRQTVDRFRSVEGKRLQDQWLLQRRARSEAEDLSGLEEAEEGGGSRSDG